MNCTFLRMTTTRVFLPDIEFGIGEKESKQVKNMFFNKITEIKPKKKKL